MEFKSQDIFRNSKFQNQVRFNENPVLNNVVSNLKGMSIDRAKRNQVLSMLSRLQGQISINDYNEILANVNSIEMRKTLTEEKTLESLKKITEQDHQKNLSAIRDLEREMRYR